MTNAVDALKAFVSDKSLKLFEKYEVLSHKEIHSRYDIYVENYAKQINIEALVAIDMVKKQFLPAATEYGTFLADSIAGFKAVGVAAPVQEDLLKKVGGLLASSSRSSGHSMRPRPRRWRRVIRSRRRRPTATRSSLPCRPSGPISMPWSSSCQRDMWPVPAYADLLFKL